ncbi:MAG: ABC transporter substrate-binding protein [Bacillota bacterium]
MSNAEVTILRRELVRSAAAAGAAALVGPFFVRSARGAARVKDPIKIGAQTVLSGPLGGYGRYFQMGVNIAIDEINSGGGVLGSRLEVEYRDEQLRAATAVANARYFVDVYGADFMIGIDSSSSALAVGEIMPQLGKPLIVTHGATHRLTEELVYQRGIRNIFRIVVPVYQDGIAGALVGKDLNVRRWAGINPDYEYGYVSWELFKTVLRKHRPDVEFVAEAWAPFGTTDFSAHISKVMAANPEGIFSVEWGGEAVTLIRQAIQFGVFDRVREWMTGMGAAMDVLEGLGDEYPEGLWASGRYWFQYPDNETNRSFVQRFYRRWGKYPHYVSEAGYSAVYTIKAAVEKTGSLATEDFIRAVEGLELETPAGRRFFRKEDHQAVYQVPWGRITHSRDYPMPVLKDLKVFPASEYYRWPPFEKIGA